MPNENFTAADGTTLPLLRGWLRKKSRTPGVWDRRYLHIDPTLKRLYYSQKGPSEHGVDGSSGMFQTVAKALAITYHKIVDGEDPSESSWVDLRLVPDVAVCRSRNGRVEPTRFDVDFGFRTLKLRADSEAQCGHWVTTLNRWREWALTNGEMVSSTARNPYASRDGYSTEEVGGAPVDLCRQVSQVPPRVAL
jgi:hypothetical protein